MSLVLQQFTEVVIATILKRMWSQEIDLGQHGVQHEESVKRETETGSFDAVRSHVSNLFVCISLLDSEMKES